MIKLWRDGSTLVQKAGLILFFVLIIWPFQVFISHSFVPTKDALNVALWAALGFTVFFLLLMLYVRKTSRVKTTMPYSRLKKLGVISVIPFMVYGLAWMNAAISAPQLITVIFGEERSYLGKAVKDHVRSRRSCDFRLAPEGVTFWLFHYCIPYSQYMSLPDGKLEVQLTTKNSFLGTYYREIKVVPSEAR
jgi:hypothetical protein